MSGDKIYKDESIQRGGKDYLLRLAFAISAAVYALPFLVSVSLPFAYWDWLMVPTYQLRGLAFAWRDLPGNVIFAFFQDPVQFRPISAIIANLQYLIFGGEFWLWYIFKWAVFGTCLWLIYGTVRNFTASRVAALVAAIYFGLHPMPFVMDLMAQDGYVVLFGLAALFWLSGRRHDAADRSHYLSWMTNGDFAIFFALCTLAALTKEIGVAFLGALLVFFILNGNVQLRFRVIARYALFIALLAFCLFRLASVNHPTSHTGLLLHGRFAEFFTAAKTWSAVTWGYLIPASTRDSLTDVTWILIVGGSVASVWKRRDLLSIMIASAAGLATAIFVIAAAYPCPRYMPVPVMFFGLLLGGATAAFETGARRTTRVLAAAFVALMCLSAPAKIYSQWLGMTQSLYETADIINFMEAKNREGYALRWTDLRIDDELRHEKGASLEEFFQHACVRWYGYSHPIPFTSLAQSGVPADRRFILLSSLAPARIDRGDLAKFGLRDLSGLAAIYVFERERYGAFEAVTGWLKRLEQKLHVDLRDPIDCQQPEPSRFGPGMPNPMYKYHYPMQDGPHLLYVFDPQKAGAIPADIKPIPLPPLRRYGAFAR